MKNTIIKILKIVLPLGIGVYLTWFFYANLSQEEKEGIPKAFASANYFWVILSLVVAWISHFSRAYRWKYQLEHLGYKPKIASLYHSVMIGYIINLTVPRSGEFARAGFFSKKENIPFDKAFGTIVAERIIDIIMLLGVFFITTLYVGGEVIEDITKPKFEQEITITQEFIDATEFKKIDGEGPLLLFLNKPLNDIKEGSIIKKIGDHTVDSKSPLAVWIGEKVIVKGTPPKKSKVLLYSIIVSLMLLGGLIFLFVTKIRNLIVNKVKGLWEGVKSIFFLKKRLAFIFHTLLIWACYIAMFWICALGVSGVENLGLDAVLVCFVVGGVAMTATPGGIGLYPLFVTAALVYFGFNKGEASGFSILMWSVQTLFLVVFGLYSLYAINVKFTASDVEADKKMIEE